MNVSSWSIKNPIPAVMLFVMLTLAGLFSFSSMKVQNFPDLDVPNITIVAALPGASPSQLENDVARVVENSLASLQGLKHIYTKVQGIFYLFSGSNFYRYRKPCNFFGSLQPG
jgi:multidrug efflux pump subunit AcrB